MAETNSNDDFVAHKKTYANFMKLTKWSIIILVVVMVALYFIINP